MIQLNQWNPLNPVGASAAPGEVSSVGQNEVQFNPSLNAIQRVSVPPTQQQYQSPISSLKQGAQQAWSGITSFAQKHPIMTAVGAAGVVAAGAICPCMAPVGLGAAAIAGARHLTGQGA